MAISDYYLTPDIGTSKDAMKRKMAYALLMQATGGTPIQHWTQALARAAQGAIGGYGLYSADQADRAREASVSNAINSLPGMTPAPTGQSSDSATPSANPQLVAALNKGAYGNNTVPTNTGDTIALPPSNPLGQLNPLMRSKFADMRTAAADQGVQFDAPEAGSIGGVRTPQQQAGLYAQGRTAPGPIVTGTLNSNHLTGNALDVVPRNTDPATVGKIVTALTQNDPRFAGMRSGATFSNLNDPLHVEVNNPQQLAAAPSIPSAPPQPTGMEPPVPNAQFAQYQGPIRSDAGPQIRPPALTQQQAGEIRTLWADPATRPLAMTKYNEYTKPKEQIIPLVDPRERAAVGIPASDTSPYTRNSVTGEIKSINNRPQVNVTNQAETEQEKKMGEYFGKLYSDVQAAGSKATKSNVTLSQMDKLIQDPKFYSGTGGEFVKTLKRAYVALGGDPEEAKSVENFTGMSNQLVYDQLGSLGNQISNSDRSFIQDAFPSIGNTTEGNKLRLQIMRAMNDRQREIAALARNYKNGRLDPEFQRQADEIGNKDLFTEDFKKSVAKTVSAASTPAAPSGPVDWQTYFGQK